ncbi:NTP transferase domain-containing protein [Candidatus Woesearchaeota archaeon]|nr:NTP transferase domain-containing protein [Candidatus Woesearchaeota archaeon]
MQVIIPLAGKGTRLQPLTNTTPKPLLNVAGKPVLAHILDKLAALDIEEYVFIIGHLGEQVREYITLNYSLNARFIEQREMKGQAHAIALAKPYIHSPVLIVFVDTIFEANLNQLENLSADGAIYVKEVEDARKFGVVIHDAAQRVTQFIEKPEHPPNNLVNIGLYYIKEHQKLFSSIGHMMKQGKHLNGEFYLVDALQRMVETGTHFTVLPVQTWLDCGNPETLLATNRYLLTQMQPSLTDTVLPYQENGTAHTKSITIIPPVHIGNNVVLKNVTIGPYVTLENGVIIEDSTIKDSIVHKNAMLTQAVLTKAIIGKHAHVRAVTQEGLMVGDQQNTMAEHGTYSL